MEIKHIIFVDDAHTFGGAQIALAHAMRALCDHTTLDITYLATVKTMSAIGYILGDDSRVRFIECPAALPLNLFTFPVRFLQTKLLVDKLILGFPSSCWILNLSGIEFCLAALTVLRLRGVSPACWLHNPERLSFFTSRSTIFRRAISALRDMVADILLFRQYRLILTPSKETAEYTRRRAKLFHPCTATLHPTITGVSPSKLEESAPLTQPSAVWMIGRIDYVHKNNGLALTTLQRLRERGIPATLTVVGDGPDRPRLLLEAEQLQLRETVSFTGWQQNPWSGIPSGAIVLIPSNWESICLVAIEALLRNVHMVLSPLAVFREVYPSEIIALQNTAEAFSDTICAVSRLDNQQLRLLYSKAAQVFCPTQFAENFLTAIQPTD